MKKTAGFFSVAAAASLFFSCASSPSSDSVVSGGTKETEYVSDNSSSEKSSEETVIKISAPVKSKKFFSSIDSKTMDLAVEGSPQSLAQAAKNIHKADVDSYSDQEKVFLYMCAKIMEYAWPSERITWEVPQPPIDNQYAGALESVQNGIYDLSTNSSDFFSAILPALVILKDGDMSAYYDRAKTDIEKALSFSKSSVFANYLYGVLCYKQGNYDDARKYLNAAVKRFSPEISEINILLAEIGYLQGDYKKSLELSESVLKKNPQHRNALKTGAKSAYALGDDAKTENYVVRILVTEPENTEYTLLRAKILMKRQDYVRASALLDACARIDDTSKEYLLVKTSLQCDWNKNYTLASQTAAKACTLYPSDVDVLLVAARIASVSGEKINGFSSIQLSQKVLADRPNSVEAKKICIIEYVKTEEYSKAYALSSQLSSDSADRELLFVHVDVCIALNKTTEALTLASKLYNASSSDEEVQIVYIKALIASSQTENAYNLINKLLDSASSKTKSVLFYHRSFLRSTEDLILQDLRSSLTNNPRNKEALYRLYKIYYNKKDWRRAQYYLKQVVALDPNNPLYLKKNAELSRLLSK